MLGLADSALDSSKHLLSQSELLDCQRVAEPDIHSESRETDGLRQHSFDEIVDLVAELLLILNLKLLLEDLVNFLDEVGLPAEQLDSLDIVKALIDVETALLPLASLLFAKQQEMQELLQQRSREAPLGTGHQHS